MSHHRKNGGNPRNGSCAMAIRVCAGQPVGAAGARPALGKTLKRCSGEAWNLLRLLLRIHHDLRRAAEACLSSGGRQLVPSSSQVFAQGLAWEWRSLETSLRSCEQTGVLFHVEAFVGICIAEGVILRADRPGESAGRDREASVFVGRSCYKKALEPAKPAIL